MVRILYAMALILLSAVTASATIIDVSQGYNGTGWGFSIYSPVKWSGSITGDANVTKWEGDGNANYSISGAEMSVSANIKKLTNSTDLLQVDLIKDGVVVDSSKTNSSFGVVSIRAPFSKYK